MQSFLFSSRGFRSFSWSPFFWWSVWSSSFLLAPYVRIGFRVLCTGVIDLLRQTLGCPLEINVEHRVGVLFSGRNLKPSNSVLNWILTFTFFFYWYMLTDHGGYRSWKLVSRKEKLGNIKFELVVPIKEILWVTGKLNSKSNLLVNVLSAVFDIFFSSSD